MSFRSTITSLSPVVIPADRPKTVSLMQLFYVCMSVIATVSMCLVTVCSLFILLLVPLESYVLCLWSILGNCITLLWSAVQSPCLRNMYAKE